MKGRILLRSFTLGHVRQLDAVSREMLCRAWKGGRGPGDKATTIDMDSTICQVLLELLGSDEILDEQGDRLNALLMLCPSTHARTIAVLR